jgi:hypothetical protein
VHCDCHTQRQAIGVITDRPLQETPRGDLPEPRVPHQAQAQGLWHDEEFHDLGVPHPAQGTRGRPRRKKRDALPWGSCSHDELQWRLPSPLERRHKSNLSPLTPTRCGWGPGDAGEDVYYSYSKRKTNNRQDGLGQREWQPAKVQSQGPTPKACTSRRGSRMRPAAA